MTFIQLGITLLSSFCLSLISLKIPYLLPKDQPNERSSHHQITPRSGPILSLILLIILLPVSEQTKFLFFAYVVLGYIDDYVNLKASIKFTFQFFIVFLLIVTTKSSFLWFIPLLSFSNFSNFMDGVNGLFLTQMILASFILYFFTPFKDYYLIIATCLLGTLPFNFPKAAFFSGDSTSLSIPTILMLPVINSPIDIQLIFFTTTCLFWVDPILTLLKRLLNREKFWIAHKTHSYQILTSNLESHSKVTMYFIFFNLASSIILIITRKPFYCFLTTFLVSILLWFSIQIHHRKRV